MCDATDIWENEVKGKNPVKPKLDRPKFDRVIEVTDSGFISAVEYDPETLILDATLVGHKGTRYRYRDVSPMQFARVVTAKSVGQAFNATIKNLPSKKLPARR